MIESCITQETQLFFYNINYEYLNEGQFFSYHSFTHNTHALLALFPLLLIITINMAVTYIYYIVSNIELYLIITLRIALTGIINKNTES
ncbi:hypothetical protein EHN25_00920 [Salmonella enterica]|nr:hypothetical protein [Salmonella enterica]